ncbi:zinc-binding dehydrogenase [Kribbella rubisoli]|uniref:zinc-binding dehydrogenase n=1 Tax=Kribbella rubisoli TaxID=3075929 RepID=UPI00102BD146|nr:zinc-binding dehydrogenase [Kribbella rubisoli]
MRRTSGHGRWLEFMGPGGILVGVLSGVPDELAQVAKASGVRSGRLLVHVEQTLPLEHAPDADRLGESGRVAGKLVLAVR